MMIILNNCDTHNITTYTHIYTHTNTCTDLVPRDDTKRLLGPAATATATGTAPRTRDAGDVGLRLTD